MKKLSVLLIFGGRSGEHEVSVNSATSIAAVINPQKYELIPLRIQKNGQWILDKSILPGNKQKQPKRGEGRYLVPDPTIRHLFTKDGQPAEHLDIVFPIIHGSYGEDGCLQGLLELAELPYVGSGVLGSAVGMDKVIQKQLLAYHDLPVTPFLSFNFHDWQKDEQSMMKNIMKKFTFPHFIKPACLGSSVGITKVHNEKELNGAIELAFSYDAKIIVEKAIPNAREIECSVLGNAAPVASILGEIVPSNEFYDYQAKYLDGKSQIIIPASLPQKISETLKKVALQTFLLLGASGMARVDFLLRKDSNEFVINEINTVPGFTAISMYPKLWEASTLRYDVLIDTLLALAQEKSKEASRLKREYKV